MSTVSDSVLPRSIIAVLSVLLLILPFGLHFVSSSGSIIGSAADIPLLEGDSDVYEGVWHFWWVGRAASSGDDPRYTTLLEYPEGTTLAWQNIGWPDTWLILATGKSTTDPVAAYNLALLYGTLLTAAGAWWAAKRWGAGPAGALLAALALAWLPSRVAHLHQHYQIASIGYLLFSLGAAKAWLSEGKLRHAVLFTVTCILACLQSAYFAVIVPVGVAATLVMSTAELRGRSSRSLVIAAALLVSLAAAGFFYMTSPGAQAATPSVSWREAVYWAAEPQSWLLPSPYGLLGSVAGLPARFSWMSNSFDGVVTPGLTLLVLFCISIVRKRRWLFAGVVLVIAILSLGPELRFLGRPLGIPLPFRLLQLLPLVSVARAPSRFALLAGFFIALESGRFFEKLTGKWKGIVAALFLFELALPTLASVSGAIPSAYEGNGAQIGPVLEIPCSRQIRRYSLFQTADGRPRLCSFLARPEDDRLPEGLEVFSLEDSGVPREEDALESGASSIIYNRWMLGDSLREACDERFALLFTFAAPEDSVWIWRIEGE